MSVDGVKKASVEMFNLVNRLKQKIGRTPKDDTPGFIDPAAIEEAEDLIRSACTECSDLVGGHLETLIDLWSQAQALDEGEERKALLETIFTVAHEVKDIGVMGGCGLIAHFAESLRDYIGSAKLNIDAQHVIVQAHLDAMIAADKNNVIDEDGPVAEELKALVQVAVEKYQ